MMSGHSPASGQQLIRILKRLSSAPAEQAATAASGIVSLEWPGPRRLRVDTALLDWMVSRGLAGRNGARIAITPEGRKALIRLAAGDAVKGHAVQHGAVAQPDPELPMVNLAESPLARLASLKAGDGTRWITALEVAAGDQLRTDFERAGMNPRVTMSYDPARTAGSRNTNTAQDVSDNALGARKRMQAALDHAGPELAGIALDVCCFLKGLEQVEMERQWPRRSAKLLLKAALCALARHYFPEARGRDRSRGIVAWGAPDYRPSS